MKMVVYKGWKDLFALWAQGEKEITPCRTRWPFRVENGILICEEKGLRYAVGVPATETYPRLFYYLISRWRNRISDRKKLEDLGGIPIMPFELAAAMESLDRGDLSPKGVLDIHEDDAGVFILIQKWVLRKGEVANKDTSWRKCRVRTLSGSLSVTHRQRNGQPKVTVVAEWKDETVLRLILQAHRSPSVNWVKDALYVAASRALGAGKAISLQRMGSLVVGGIRAPSSIGLSVMPTPSYLVKPID